MMAAMSKYQKDYAGVTAGTYVYKPPSNEEKEKEWERQSLERQRAERVEAAAAVNRNPVAPPPVAPPPVQQPVYSNPAVSRIQKDYDPPAVVQKPPAVNPYSEAQQRAEQNLMRQEPAYKYTPPTTPSIYDREEKYGLAPNIPKPTAGFGSNKSIYDQPKDSGYYLSPMPKTGLRDVTFDDKLKEQDLFRFRGQDLAPNIPPPTSGLTYEQLIDKVYNDPQNSGLSALEKEQILNNLVSYPKYYQAMISGSLPPQDAGAFLKKNDLLSAAVTPQSPIYNYPAYPNLPLMYQDRYNFAQKMANLPINKQKAPDKQVDTVLRLDKETPNQTSKINPDDLPYGATPIRTYVQGQGWNEGVKLPFIPGGYTEADIIKAGNDEVAKYDEASPNFQKGRKQFEGYYLAPNGRYYPVNQPKAEYAIQQARDAGYGRLTNAQADNPYFMKQFYEGYSKDVEDFIRNFGPENLWRYDPNWKNAGLKYSNPTTSPAPVWNTGNSGGSGGMQSDDPRNRGWYFNPAVNWVT